MFIEGDPEERANKAWTALRSLLWVGPEANVILTDPVMAQAIKDQWYSWGATCRAFITVTDEVTRATVRKAFRLSYTENWKRRHQLGKGPVELEGRVDPKKGYTTYLVDADYQIQKHSRVEPPPEPPPQPMTPEMREQLRRVMSMLGGFHARDAYDPLVPGSQNLPAPLLRDVSDPNRAPVLPPDASIVQLHVVNGPGASTARGDDPDAQEPRRGPGDVAEEPIERKVQCCTCYDAFCGRPCRCGGQG
jgi:hypothetical protein